MMTCIFFLLKKNQAEIYVLPSFFSHARTAVVINTSSIFVLLLQTVFGLRHSPDLCYTRQVHVPSERSPLRVGRAMHRRAQPALLPFLPDFAVGAVVLVLPQDDGPLHRGCWRLRGRSCRPGTRESVSRQPVKTPNPVLGYAETATARDCKIR